MLKLQGHASVLQEALTMSLLADAFVADQISKVKNQGTLTFSRPVERGVVTNWPLQLDIWQRLLPQAMKGTDPSGSNLLVTAFPFTPETLTGYLDQVRRKRPCLSRSAGHSIWPPPPTHTQNPGGVRGAWVCFPSAPAGTGGSWRPLPARVHRRGGQVVLPRGTAPRILPEAPLSHTLRGTLAYPPRHTPRGTARSACGLLLLAVQQPLFFKSRLAPPPRSMLMPRWTLDTARRTRCPW